MPGSATSCCTAAKAACWPAGREIQPTGEGWTVGVRHPLRPDQRIGEIRLRNGALGTSGAGTQFFFHEGRRLGHILDPRTGRPAEGTLSATVLARSAAEADALSTAFYVLRTRLPQSGRYCRRLQRSGLHGGRGWPPCCSRRERALVRSKSLPAVWPTATGYRKASRQ